jgi:hypothetical protein
MAADADPDPDPDPDELLPNCIYAK